MALLIHGPADGREVATNPYREIWVAMLDDEPRVLSTDNTAEAVDLLDRVGRGNWFLYERVHDDDQDAAPRYVFVERPAWNTY